MKRSKRCPHGWTKPQNLKNCEACKRERNVQAKLRRKAKKKSATASDKLAHAREMMQTWARKLRLATTTHRKWERRFNALERQAAVEKAVAEVEARQKFERPTRAISFDDVK